MVLRTLLFILLMTKNLQTSASGFDAYSSCYRTSRKRQDLPCDFGSQTWCTIPGNSYPWHAVRRFVHENQGLMRRMYGDERHISVLRAELESNDIEYFSSPSIKEEFRRRYSKDMDGAKDFVKLFMNNEGRKFFNDPKLAKATKVEKVQKSIEEKSSNVLYQNHIKNAKDDDKTLAGNVLINNTFHKTTTSSPLTTKASIIEPTTVFTTNAAPTSNQSNQVTESINSTSAAPVTDATIQLTTKADEYNITKPPMANDTFLNDEDFEYGLETEDPPTTTSTDSLMTTEIEFEEEIAPKDKEDYEETGEDVGIEEQMTAEEPVSSESPPMIRLKGVNACPVKEEVVAPFWANNTRGEVLALLNLYPFEQYVHWEKCTYEHKQMFCREGCRCEQQYRLHRLLAYDPNNECRGIFSDWFRFPSCCVCKCYDLPMEFRLTSRSPRFHNFDLYGFNQQQNP